MVENFSEDPWQNIFMKMGSFTIFHVHIARKRIVELSENTDILNMASTLWFLLNMPIKFWGECVLIAAHLINWIPTLILSGQTLLEVIAGKLTKYDHLHIFRFLFYAQRLPGSTNRFNDRARCCIFLGYLFRKKAWKLFDIELEEIFISQNVIFSWKYFPFPIWCYIMGKLSWTISG